MRQGPNYSQPCFYDDHGRLVITVPLELVEDFEGCSCVRFHDNGDGSFHLKIFDEMD